MAKISAFSLVEKLPGLAGLSCRAQQSTQSKSVLLCACVLELGARDCWARHIQVCGSAAPFLHAPVGTQYQLLEVKRLAEGSGWIRVCMHVC